MFTYYSRGVLYLSSVMYNSYVKCLPVLLNFLDFYEIIKVGVCVSFSKYYEFFCIQFEMLVH